jgi:hypothetical protein
MLKMLYFWKEGNRIKRDKNQEHYE